MSVHLTFAGEATGSHNGAVTKLAFSDDKLFSGSTDKTIIQWDYDPVEWSVKIKKVLKFHKDKITGLVVGKSGEKYYLISSSWDSSVNILDLEDNQSTSFFVGGNHAITSMSLSSNYRVIAVSCIDKKVRVYNTLGDCKKEIPTADIVSSVEFSPNTATPYSLVYAGWDEIIYHCEDATVSSHAKALPKHSIGQIKTVCVSPDGSLVAGAGKDQSLILYDLNQNTFLYSIPVGHTTFAQNYSPTRYWSCLATEEGILIIDLENKQSEKYTSGRNSPCTALAWDANGTVLFAGFEDGKIEIWRAPF